MAVLPEEIPTGTLKGQFYFVNEDNIDADTKPELTVVKGFVRCVASVKTLRMASKKAIVIPLRFDAKFDGQGNLVPENGNGIGMEMPAVDSPLFDTTGWTWTATFEFVEVETGFTVNLAPVTFQIFEGKVTDLSEIIPVEASPGIVTTRGLKGEPGLDGSNVLPTNDAVAQAINTEGPTKTALSAAIGESMVPVEQRLTIAGANAISTVENMVRSANKSATTRGRASFAGEPSIESIGKTSIGSVNPTGGAWGIHSNGRGYAAAGSTNQLLTFDAGSPDHEVEATIAPRANGVGVSFRVLDQSTHLRLGFFPTTNLLRLAKRVSSTVTSLRDTYGGAGSFPIIAGQEYRLRVTVVGDMIRVYVNGALSLTHRLKGGDEDIFSGQTLAGLYASGDSVSTFADLNVRNAGALIVRDSPDAWKADNAAGPQVTPTHEGSGQAVHPDVIDFGEGNNWNGYRYWMAHTPYPFSLESAEKPNIVASQDGDTWEVPAGVTNPISVGFDPDITMVGNRMYVVSQGPIYTWSDDGVTWAPHQYIFNALVGETSPSILLDEGIYRMWSIQKRDGAPYRVLHRTALDILGPWSAPEELPMRADATRNRDLWHIDVVKHEGVHYALVAECTKGTSGQGTLLYIAQSPDGYGWITSADPVIGKGVPEDWDDAQIYRSTFIPRGIGDGLWFDCWYSARKTSGAWRIGRTPIQKKRDV